MTYSAVFFDIDGTLIDSNDAHILAWDEAFRGIDVQFDRKEIHAHIGKGADMLIPALLPQSSESQRKELADAQGSVFKARYLDDVKPFPDAHALLARAKAAGQMVVMASSASESQLDHYLDLLGARDLVATTTSADDVGNTKPAPDIFAVALKKVARLEAKEAVVVGDTPYDIEAAAKCGIAAIALRSGGFSDQALTDAGAISLYDDAAALLRHYDDSPLGVGGSPLVG